MNKTIQSNSFRPFSSSLLDKWVKHLDDESNPQIEDNFLMKNLRKCLVDFRQFAVLFEAEARKLAEQDPVFCSLSTSKEKENFMLWLDEKIRKALDIYWAPLSQAATQYTSPAYSDQLNNIVNLQPKIESLIGNLNALVEAPPDAAISIDDLLLFFDELTLIRVAPYTKTALIGIPYRVAETDSADGDILAGIAHELGHFLYWQLGEFDSLDLKHEQVMNAVETALKGKLNASKHRSIRYIDAWFEELFADVVGANIAGGNHLNVSKSMVIRNNKMSTRAGHNDHEHVADILRPLVSMYVLNNVQKDALESWRMFLKNDFPVDSALPIELNGEHADERKISRRADELSTVLLEAVDVITDQLKNVSSNTPFQSQLSPISTIEMLSRKANRLSKKIFEKRGRENSTDSEDGHSVLDIFLEPQTLEAGDQLHPHTVTTGAHSYSFTIYHTDF